MTANRIRPPMARTLRQAILGISSASLFFSTTLTPLVAQIAGMAPPPGATAGQTTNLYSAEELDAILASIALYPDQLLTQVLMAAAFPDQISALANWLTVGGNGSLRGDRMDQALRPLPWDPAVKSLAPFPQVVSIMASHLDWITQIAFAVAEQEAATFDSVQRLRRQAKLAGFLRSTNQQVVRNDGDLIVIAPVSQSVVYVPVYNPQVVYGTWGYPSYPPYYFPPSYAVPGNVIMTGIYFGIGTAVVGSLWGWATPRWRERNFYVDPRRYDYFRQNYHAPAGDWGRWDHDQWRPPVRTGDRGQDRPMPPRPADNQFRPPGQRPGEERAQPMPPRFGDQPVRPGSPQPAEGRDQMVAPRLGQGQIHTGPSQPGDNRQERVIPPRPEGQERVAPPRPDGQMRPVPIQPGEGPGQPTAPQQRQGQSSPPPGRTGANQEQHMTTPHGGQGQAPQAAPRGPDAAAGQVRPAPVMQPNAGSSHTAPQAGGERAARPAQPAEGQDRQGQQR